MITFKTRDHKEHWAKWFSNFHQHYHLRLKKLFTAGAPAAGYYKAFETELSSITGRTVILHTDHHFSFGGDEYPQTTEYKWFNLTEEEAAMFLIKWS